MMPSFSSFLTLFTGYALFLMSEAVFWNVFAFDRAATQVYFLLPVRFSRVLAGKNLAALLFVLLEITLITGICLALRLPVSFASIAEACSVSAVLCIYLLGVGNVVSVYFPRPANPEDSWGASGRKQRAFLLFPIFAVVLTPVLLAYLARYANCDMNNADINGDGGVNNFDIDPFVACLIAGGCP